MPDESQKIGNLYKNLELLQSKASNEVTYLTEFWNR